MSREQTGVDGVERMLRIVETVPAGRVITYGDLSELADHGGPRTAGALMASQGSAVPWHRVVSAQGQLPAGLWPEAMRRWRGEGTPLAPDGARVDVALARWIPTPEDLLALNVLLEGADSAVGEADVGGSGHTASPTHPPLPSADGMHRSEPT